MRLHGPVLLLLLGAAACADDAGDGIAPVSAAAAPPLEGMVDDGEPFTLESLQGEPAVLIFYRGAFCRICLRRLKDLDDHEDAYHDLDARVVAITPDPPELARRTVEELDLDVPVVSVDRAVLDRWGVWPGGERFPRPASFVVDGAGRIRYGHVGETAADRLSDVSLLEEVETLAAPPLTAPDR